MNCSFQKQLASNIKQSIATESRIIVSADKTNNYHKLEKDHYNKLVLDNVTKTYKKTDAAIEAEVQLKAKEIASELELSDRVEVSAKKTVTDTVTVTVKTITLKDHKENFVDCPFCR